MDIELLLPSVLFLNVALVLSLLRLLSRVLQTVSHS